MPRLRWDLVVRIRREIEAGTYETPEKWELALSRLQEDLEQETLHQRRATSVGGTTSSTACQAGATVTGCSGFGVYISRPASLKYSIKECQPNAPARRSLAIARDPSLARRLSSEGPCQPHPPPYKVCSRCPSLR